MRICVVTPAFPLDDEDYRAAFSLDLVRSLERRGHAVFVHVPRRKGARSWPGVRVRGFRWLGGQKAIARTRWWHPRDLAELVSLVVAGTVSLLRLVDDEDIDACLALWAFPSGVFAYSACRRRRVPYSVWLLGSDVWTYGGVPVFRQVLRRVIRNADRCFADGRALAEAARGIASRPCEFLPTSRVLPPAPRNEVAADEPTRFLFVGRFDRVKGVDVLIEAAALLARRRADFHLRVHGEGPERETLRGLVAARELDERVAIAGPLGRQGMSDALARADCLVIPSRMESIPVVMSDALQREVPVIVSAVGDMADIVSEYAVGDFFEPDHPDSLARAMERFMDGKPDPAGAFRRAMEYLSIDRAADEYLAGMGARSHDETR